jgi:hypothetical protein
MYIYVYQGCHGQLDVLHTAKPYGAPRTSCSNAYTPVQLYIAALA